jgi:ABC-type nitrate/sulfonate/bicarbonate transport system permease component
MRQLKQATPHLPWLSRLRGQMIGYVSRYSLIFAFLLAWQISSIIIAKPVQFPPLTAVARAFVDLLGSGALAADVGASLGRILIGFGLAATVGIPLGLAMGISKYVNLIFDPVIEFLRPISSIAWIPLFLSIMGIGDQIAISVVIYASIFPIALNTLAGVRQVKKEYIQSAQTIGAGRWLIMKHVVLPGALSQIFAGLRVAYGIAWMGIVAAELVGTSSGLGFMITHYQRLFYSGGIVTGMFAIAVFGLLGDKFFGHLQTWLTPWAESSVRK